MKVDVHRFVQGITETKNNNRNHTHQTIKYMYTNLDGLSNKTAAMKALTVLYTETKANPEMLNVSLFNIDQYSTIRKDRPNQTAPGGGVAILIKKKFTIDETSVSFLNDHEAKESVWCEVKSREGKDIVLGMIYKTPSSVQNNDTVNDLI